MNSGSWPQRAALGPALVAALLVALACGGERPVTQDVVSAVPWASGEMSTYRLEDRDGNQRGTGTLQVDEVGNRFRLTLEFSDDSNIDNSIVEVEAATLKPVSLRRAIRSGEQSDIIEAEYMGDQVRIRATSDGNTRQSFLRIPEHSYDNDSSLFVWRAMPLARGYTASYNTVVTNRRKNHVVTVAVSGPGEVEVPAGVFQAWRVDIEGGGVRQVAWYSADEQHLLVKYDNSRLVFLLEETTAG